MPAKVRDLKPASYNPRKITDKQLAVLGRALKEFGDLGGIVLNRKTGNLVGGHQRVKHLDPAWVIVTKPIKDATGTTARGYIETPWARLDYREVDWSEEKEKAANLAANKHGGAFDLDGVRGILSSLELAKFDLDLTGFLADERFTLFGQEAAEAKNPDDAPAVGKKAISKRGDLYELGGHLLLCGDATSKDDWVKLMGVEKASCVFTDPPYGVSYESKSGNFDVIEGDRKRNDELLHLLSKSFSAAARYTNDSAAFYIWHASATREDFEAAIKAASLMERQYLIWAKTGIALGHSDYQWSHEPCFYASKAGIKPLFYGDRAQPTIWRVKYASKVDVATIIGPGIAILDGCGRTLWLQTRMPKGKKARTIRLEAEKSVVLAQCDDQAGTLWEVSKDHNYKHPTQKPTELAARALQNSTKPGQIVVDMFAGSGSTLIAAEMTQRVFHGMELDPKYCDVIIARWEQFTGRKAVRA